MHRDGTLRVVAGASRTGKTATASQLTRAASHLLAWDPKGHWSARERCRRAESGVDLQRALLRANLAPLRIAFTHHDRAAFDLWARCAFAWTRHLAAHGAPAPWLVAEETSAVTHAGKAPPGWHLLLTQGLEYGPQIIAITQRPAESDSTALGNASILRVFRLSRASDRRAMGEELDVEPDELRDLPPGAYRERDLRTGETVAGQLKF